MPTPTVTDMSHFLDENGHIPPRRAGRALRDHLGSIVAFVSAVLAGRHSIPPQCRRRPRRRRCNGIIEAVISSRHDEIAWRCPDCGDEGTIHGWRGTPWDLSQTKPVSSPGVDGPRFTTTARPIWNAIDPGLRVRLLNNAWCSSCLTGTSMALESGRMMGGDLVLEGRCVRCDGPVTRVVEGEGLPHPRPSSPTERGPANQPELPARIDPGEIVSDEVVAMLAKELRRLIADSFPAATPSPQHAERTIRFMPLSTQITRRREELGLDVRTLSRRLKIPQYRIRDIEEARLGKIVPEFLRRYVEALELEEFFADWQKANPALAREFELS